ncbi:putative phosphoglycerol geranylgeranyltransferase [Halosimplex litoreum]|uniref:Geranylgeranylglyceryl phosphate synthase n=1 Tax=Halosimplex litoreum TaxID=1198301 RepID=A0A7T3KWK8_9EURY|nr:putative phosphoglycerol geranylgeranyltransferase [Halosimplex litoreum]QPV64035.1 putative phosphoglycerol geranylgeranyltransferase [Halosimplex litoreum]
MQRPWDDWDHILKVDPDKDLVDGETYADVVTCGTDAIEVGGTTGVTEEKMADVVEACAEYDVPLYVEPSNPANVVYRGGVDGYLVPAVLNAGDIAWLSGVQKEWVRIDDDIDWERTFTEGYIVLNPDSAAATLTQSDCDLDPSDVAAYAEVGERMLGQEIVYAEYSGTFGDPEIVAAAADALDDATLFYGGGIHDYESANTMADHADTVVVGDLVHDEGVDAVVETVEGAKDAKAATISE